MKKFETFSNLHKVIIISILGILAIIGYMSYDKIKDNKQPKLELEDNSNIDNKIASIKNELTFSKLEQSERISLFDIETYIYIDFDMDSIKGYYSPDDKRFQAITISRIKPEKNPEKYPEFLYVYKIIGPSIVGGITSQYAYVSLDALLSDISWVGTAYNYLTPPNIYKATWEYEKYEPSPINGISQSEYEDIKNGKYPNIQIIGTDTDNSQSDSNKHTTNEQPINQDSTPIKEPNYLEEDNSGEIGTLVKTYNTFDADVLGDYRIEQYVIKIFQHTDGNYSWRRYWCPYIEIIKATEVSSRKRFKSINDTLISATQSLTEYYAGTTLTVSDLTEE